LPRLDAIVTIVGGLGGRFDHEMGNVRALHAFAGRFARLVLLGRRQYCEVLTGGVTHRVRVCGAWSGTDAHCGLLPIGGACAAVTTTGLRWNVSEQRLAFDGLVSTSNKLAISSPATSAPVDVTIRTSHPLVWTLSRSETSRSCSSSTGVGAAADTTSTTHRLADRRRHGVVPSKL
jgi:thiamine pyrophosphokinase